MKKAVIYYKDTYNIGDTIQTLAASRLIGNVDLFLDRERLDQYDGAEAKLLSNGYFMKEPSHWPPSKKLHPLFVSFHLSGYYGAEQKMLNPELKSYYNSFGPIGCRDRDTMRRLQAIGVEAYYSACLTLTLNFEGEIERGNEILFVDPFLKSNSESYRKTLMDRMVPDNLKSDVSYIHHDLDIHNKTVHQRMEIAEKLLRRYAAAKLVITSRIHCALPCLALGTPVYFVDMGYDRPEARKRFDGVLDLMPTLGQDNFPIASSNPFHKMLRKLNAQTLLSSKPREDLINWVSHVNEDLQAKAHAEAIRQKVKSFFEI